MSTSVALEFVCGAVLTVVAMFDPLCLCREMRKRRRNANREKRLKKMEGERRTIRTS